MPACAFSVSLKVTRPSWSIFRISLSPISVVDRYSWSSENGSKLLRLAPMVVRSEVPAPGVNDEAVRAELTLRLVALEGPVSRANPPAPPNRLRKQERGGSGDRGAFDRRRQLEGRLERLDPAPDTLGQHAMDLGERAVGTVRAQPETTGRDKPEDDGRGLVVGEHERRETEARLQAIAPADAALAFDRDSELLQRRDVAADRAAVDPELVRDLTTRRQRPCLEELEELEQAGGGRTHRPE